LSYNKEHEIYQLKEEVNPALNEKFDGRGKTLFRWKQVSGEKLGVE